MSSSDQNHKLFFSGAISGFAEGIAVQPFDMVKTRHQLNSGHNLGVFQTLGQLYKEGGFFRLYRGMAAELIGIMPKSSGMYAIYEIARRELSETFGYGDTTLVNGVAGFVSGFPESIIVTPTQVIKVRLQAKEHLGRYNNTIDCLTKVLKQEGITSLYIGLGPTLFRNCVWNTVYFGTMHFLKKQLPTPDSQIMNTAQTLLTGFFGAVFATCFNAPFDVVKSRFQSQLTIPGEPVKYKNTIQSLMLIYKEEGLSACYKGFKPKAIRMGLGGAVAMASFELVNKILL